MYPIRSKVWSWKAGQQMHVLGLLGVHDLRERVQNLWESFAVPERCGPVHRWSNHVPTSWIRTADGVKSLTHLMKHWFDSMSNGEGQVLGAGDEVGSAGQETNRRLRADLLQGGHEPLQVVADEHLAALDELAGTTRVFVHMLPDIGVTDQREQMRHLAGTTELGSSGFGKLRDRNLRLRSDVFYNCHRKLSAMLPCYMFFPCATSCPFLVFFLLYIIRCLKPVWGSYVCRVI